MGGAVSAIAGPVLGTVGGLISGGKAADASKGQAEALRAAADKASAMAQFRPYGMTTAFGTSAFTPEGQGSYTLSPQLKALQDQLFAQMGSYDPTKISQAAQPIVGGAESLFNLGQQYLATSPEQAASEYMAQQQSLLAGTREQQLANIRNQQLQTGRTGLATGGTTTGMQATNPEMAAYYNALAQQNAQLASQADVEGRKRVTFGAGLFGTGGELLGQVPALESAAYNPLKTQLGLLGTTEAMGQQPYTTSIDLANQYAQAGARQGQLYLQPQQAAAQAYSQYQGYSPMGTALSGLGSAMSGGGGGGASSWFSSLIGSNAGTAARYGTNLGSQQTNMLQAQEQGLWG
jgi:hypothetical protein